MWGSYVGLVIGGLVEQYYAYTLNSSYIFAPIIHKILYLDLQSLIVFMFLGFLLGWGIHSLIRGFK
jgi:hypothetical protein